MVMIPRKASRNENNRRKNGLNLIGCNRDRGLGFVLESIENSMKGKLPTNCILLPANLNQKSKYIYRNNIFVGNPEYLEAALIKFSLPKVSACTIRFDLIYFTASFTATRYPDITTVG